MQFDKYIVFEHKAWHKLQKYTEFAKGEISGIGIVEALPNFFYVPEVFLFKQVSTATHTSIDREDYMKFTSNMMKAGEPIEKLKLWWHTHGDMSVFWSPTDEANIQDFDWEKPEDNWVLSIVLNKSGNYKTRLDIFSPLRLTIHDLNVVVREPDYGNLDQVIQHEVKEKVQQNHTKIRRIEPDPVEEGVRKFEESLKKDIPLIGEVHES